MQVTPLTKEIALSNINYLLEIDSSIKDDKWAPINFLKDCDSKWEYSLIATENQKVIGFLICSVKGKSLHIHRLAVSQEHQRKKVGTMLLKNIYKCCSNNNLYFITLKVRKSNKLVQMFYEKNGFEKIDSENSRFLYKKMIL